MGLDQLGNAPWVTVLTGPGQHQAGAGDQGPEALPHRHVEADRRLLHQHVAGVQPIAALHPVQALGQRPVRVAHALGLASGAGGVDHVGQVIAVQVQPGRLAWPAVQVQLVEGDDADPFGAGQAVEALAVAEQQAGAAVGQHVAQAFGGVIDVQRHIGTAGLEDGQQADQQLRRALQADRHAGLGADALVAQVMRQAVGLLVQAGVVELAAVPDQRGVRRGGPGLVVELLDQPPSGRRPGRLAPLTQALAVVRRVQGHLAQRALGVPGHMVEQRQQMARQALEGLAVEAFAGVVEGQGQATLRVFFAVQLQVDLGFAAVPRQLVGEQTGQATQGRQVALLVVEHHLEQAMLAGGGQRLEHLLERQVLVCLGFQRGLAYLGQQLHEGLARPRGGTQHLGVDEEPD